MTEKEIEIINQIKAMVVVRKEAKNRRTETARAYSKLAPNGSYGVYYGMPGVREAYRAMVGAMDDAEKARNTLHDLYYGLAEMRKRDPNPHQRK